MQTKIAVKMVLDRWNTSMQILDTLIDSMSDELLQKEIAPGKNRGIYVLGHLIAVHDDMFHLLDMGNKLYPELNEPFLKNADRITTELPSAKILRENWAKQCETFRQKFENLKPEDWFEKHTVVSAEDFVKEPHRNKLNIILTRTTHLQHHIGQLQLLN